MRRFLEAVASTSVFAESWEHLQPARQTEQLQQRLHVDVLLGVGVSVVKIAGMQHD